VISNAVQYLLKLKEENMLDGINIQGLKEYIKILLII